MNREVGYIWQGFFLLLAGFGIVQLLASIKPAADTTIGDSTFYGTQINAKNNTAFNKRGQALFQSNCAACHQIKKDLTGPGLESAEDRIKDKKLLYAWIRNSPAVLKTGNRYFTDLYNKWNKTPMNTFPNLTDEEIDDILEYIRQSR
jgi:mono/diheme cytochrome c family protein